MKMPKMPKIPKSMKKFMPNFVLLIAGFIGLSVLFSIITNNKKKPSSGMTVEDGNETNEINIGPSASKPLGQNGDFETVAPSLDNGDKPIGEGVSVPTCDPSDLLPKDTNNEWAKMNPTGAGDLDSVNLLKAGHHVGIDTVGSSLRNANLQVRSEHPNPIADKNLSPWNMTTIQPDLMRSPLEIGAR